MRQIISGLLALLFLVGVAGVATPATADAASCVRFSATHFNAPGNDNYAENLNGEWVRIKNYCSTTKSVCEAGRSTTTARSTRTPSRAP